MKQRWIFGLALSLSMACTPAVDDSPSSSTGGSTGNNTGGSKAGGTGGGSTSTGGTGGGSTSTGGTGGGSTSTGGSPGSSGGTGGGSTSTGGSGGGAGGSGGAAGGTGGSTDGGGTPSTDTGGGAGAGGGTGMGPAAALHDYVIKVPCPTQGGTGKSCTIATDVRGFDKPVMIGGDAATTYKVKLKICAVYEARPYTGCTAHPESPKVCINGMPSTGGFAPTYPTLALKSGDKTYYLNMESGYADKIFKFDYTATFEIKGGSMVNFISNGGSNGGVYTSFQGPGNPSCPNVPGVPAGFLGQYMHVQVVSTDPMN